MLSLDPGVREAMGDGYFERDDCLELDWIKEHQILLLLFNQVYCPYRALKL